MPQMDDLVSVEVDGLGETIVPSFTGQRVRNAVVANKFRKEGSEVDGLRTLYRVNFA